MADRQSVPQWWSWNLQVSQTSGISQISLNSWISHNLPTSRKKNKRPNSQEEKRDKKQLLHPGLPWFINWTWFLWYEIFPLASWAWRAGYAPSHLLHTCSLAKHGRPEKILQFFATAKNISVVNILRVLNPKQQLLGGNITLSQMRRHNLKIFTFLW